MRFGFEIDVTDAKISATTFNSETLQKITPSTIPSGLQVYRKRTPNQIPK